MSPLILSIDLGTSSARTALFNPLGVRLPNTLAQQSYPLITDPDGRAEIDPGMLQSAVLRCLEQTLQRFRTDPTLRPRRIEAIGLSCFWHSLIGCDSTGRPLTNIITWADARPLPDAAQLRAEFDEKSLHAQTGCMLRSSFWPAKLRWYKRTQPRKFATIKQWLSPAEWLQLSLTGHAHHSVAMATGSCLFNPSKLAYDPQLLKISHLSPSQLRPLNDDSTPVAGPLAKLFPELKDRPWFPGIGDGAASNLGSGATQPGFAALNVGTSAALRVVRSSGPVTAPLGLFCYRLDPQRFLVGGAVSNAGNLRSWCLRELQLPDAAATEIALANRPSPAHGLVVLPFWNPERAPTWDEDATGSIHGLRQHSSSLDILQAITEATYHRLAKIADLLLASDPSTPTKFIVSGGIQRSPTSLQRLADVLGKPLHPNDEMEASLRGAAIFAIEKLGLPSPPSPLQKPLKPRQKYAALYAIERAKLQSLEALLAPTPTPTKSPKSPKVARP